MIERRNWKTRPWGRREATDRRDDNAVDGAAAPASAGALPLLWFLAGEGQSSAVQCWSTAPDTTMVPCFRSEEDAGELSRRAGVEPVHALGFSLLAVADLMADLDHPVFLVTGVTEAGQVEGAYLPAPPPVAGARPGATQAA